MRCDHAHQAPVARLVQRHNWHEVRDFSHSFRGQESRDEYIGIRHVELFVSSLIRVAGPQQKASAAFLVIQKPGKHAGRVEERKTVPIDGAVDMPTSAAVCMSPMMP